MEPKGHLTLQKEEILPKGCGKSFACDKEWMSKALDKKAVNLELKQISGGLSGATLTKVFVQFEDETNLNLIAKYSSAADADPIPIAERALQSLVNPSVL
jgi:hypothetical protein